jgi:hypothetical protein
MYEDSGGKEGWDTIGEGGRKLIFWGYCQGKSKGEMEHVKGFNGVGYIFLRQSSNTSVLHAILHGEF